MPFNVGIPWAALQVITTAAVNVPELIVLSVTGILIGSQARSISISHVHLKLPRVFLITSSNMKLSGLGNHILNAVLFNLIGLEILAVLLDWHYVFSGLLSIPAVILTNLLF